MKDPTEGMKLEPAEGLGYYYTAADLKALVEQRAMELNATVTVQPLGLGEVIFNEFIVECRSANGRVQLRAKTVVNLVDSDLRHVERSLSIVNKSEVLVSENFLPKITLKTDGKNPTAFLEVSSYEDRQLTKTELMDELIQPVLSLC